MCVISLIVFTDKYQGHIHANLANFRVLLELLGGSVALDMVDVSHKTPA